MALTKVKASNITLSTPAANSNDTTPATTQYVTTAVANLIDNAPANLNTLNELAAAMADNDSFFSTVLPLSGGTLTGNVFSGNKTGLTDTNTGHAFAPGGLVYHTTAGTIAQSLNRLTNDGPVLRFVGNGTTAGSVGVLNGGLSFASSPSLTTRMIITSSGNVGINSSASNAKLEVVATSGEILRADGNNGLGVLVANQTHLYTYKLAIGQAYQTSNNMGDSKLQLGNNYAFGGVYSAFGETLNSQSTIVGNNIRPVVGTNNQVMRHYSGADAGNFMKITYNKGFSFHTGLTTTQGSGVSEDTNERARIDTSGNLSVNAPSNLDVGGTGPGIALMNSGQLRVGGNDGTSMYTGYQLLLDRMNTPGDGPNLVLSRNGFFKAAIGGIQGGSGNSTSAEGNLTFYTATTSAFNERMRIASNNAVYSNPRATDGFLMAEITKQHLGNDSNGTGDITITVVCTNQSGVYDAFQVMLYLNHTGNSAPIEHAQYLIEGYQRSSNVYHLGTTHIAGDSRPISVSTSGLTMTITIQSEGSSTATQGVYARALGNYYGISSIS